MDISALPPPAAQVRRFLQVRHQTLALCSGLSAEDQQIQSMPDASPTKWHLAHTTWFFETFVLNPIGYPPYDPDFSLLFNSYYEHVGPRHPRPARGLITRPSLATVLAYRAEIDARVIAALEAADHERLDQITPLIALGLQHEQQHQELILMDIKHAFFANPLAPAYDEATEPVAMTTRAHGLAWREFTSGLIIVGAASGFHFDNEGPRHQVWLEPFKIAEPLVTCGEWLAFIADGGYTTSTLWLSDGWAAARREDWRAPLYWDLDHGDGPRVFTLGGWRPVSAFEPVCHVSYYEADAFARWRGARLPTEFEWEALATGSPSPDLADLGLHPRAPAADAGDLQLFGQVWQWTASAYGPYPRFRPVAGAIGEYNGKFMSGQMVLRGGACATPPGHTRSTYRNFFPPAARWAFSGLRLADDV